MDAGLRNTTALHQRQDETAVTDHLLRRDIRTLGFELGQIIARHGSEELYEQVERLREMSKARRAGDAEADAQLRNLLGDLDTDRLGEVIRAMSCYFDLANLAEDRHRIRVLRDREQRIHPAPRRESIGDAIQQLKERGFTADQVRDLLHGVMVELVFTAHPTEAKRRTVRNSLRRLREDLVTLDRQRLLPRERERLITDIQTDLDCLWETDPLRPSKPTVLEEVRRSLFVVDSLWEVAPWLLRSVQSGFEQAFPEEDANMPQLVRFGTWIGGDRDGNPYVTAHVTRQAIRTLRSMALDKHIAMAREVSQVLSISTTYHPVHAKLEEAIQTAIERWDDIRYFAETRNPLERYRLWLYVIRYRLEKTQNPEPFDDPQHNAAYPNADALLEDLQLIVESLQASGHQNLAHGLLQDWISRVHVFGFHMARMDIREHSGRLHESIAELARHAGLCDDYLALDEDGRCELLTRPIHTPQARGIHMNDLTPETTETMRLFLLLERKARTFGLEPLGTLIISMTHHVSDVLTMLFLGRLAAAFEGENEVAATLPIVPLFETIDDLERCGSMLDALLQHPAYREYVTQTGEEQICMVGYSDSCKDGGFLASNWHLHEAQEQLAEVADRHGVKLTIFHGRGGSLGRGGGPAARGILSLPSQSNHGTIRITEQGEVLAERYDDPEIALRHLEQVGCATLLKSAAIDPDVPDHWQQVIAKASHAAFEAYRTLRDNEVFLEYFSQATPIDIIETLPIGSRPSRRGGQRQLQNLRAIPYTFAWTQNRHLLTGFYGIGSGLQAAAGEDWSLLREMYHQWPMFHAMIHNAELALVKCDMDIAWHYAMLLDQRADGEKMWNQIREEYERSRRAVLRIVEEDELLSGADWLRRSVQARNPYVDVLNFAQIELLRRRKQLLLNSELNEEQEARLKNIERQLRLSVQGIASGLRNTG